MLTQGGRPAAGQTVSFTLDPPSAGGATLARRERRHRRRRECRRVDPHGPGHRLRGRGADRRQPRPRSPSSSKAATTGTVLVAPLPRAVELTAAGRGHHRGAVLRRSRAPNLNLDQPPDPHRPQSAPVALGRHRAGRFVEHHGGERGDRPGEVSDVHGGGQGVRRHPRVEPLAGATVQVSLPLYDAIPDPVGTYSVTTTLNFAPPLAAAAALAAPWADLSTARSIRRSSGSTSRSTRSRRRPAADPLGAGAGGIAAPAGRPAGRRQRRADRLPGRARRERRREPRRDRARALRQPAARAGGGACRPSPTTPPLSWTASASFRHSSVAPSSSAGSYLVTHTLSGAQFGPNAAGDGVAGFARPADPAGLHFGTATGHALTIGSHGIHPAARHRRARGLRTAGARAARVCRPTCRRSSPRCSRWLSRPMGRPPAAPRSTASSVRRSASPPAA